MELASVLFKCSCAVITQYIDLGCVDGTAAARRQHPHSCFTIYQVSRHQTAMDHTRVDRPLVDPLQMQTLVGAWWWRQALFTFEVGKAKEETRARTSSPLAPRTIEQPQACSIGRRASSWRLRCTGKHLHVPGGGCKHSPPLKGRTSTAVQPVHSCSASAWC